MAPSHTAACPPRSGDAAASTIRGAATKCPSLPRNPLSLQPLRRSRLFPATVNYRRHLLSGMACAARPLAHNKRQWPSTTTSSCTCHAERPATPRGGSSRTTRSTATGSCPDSACSLTAAGRLPFAAGSYAPYGHSESFPEPVLMAPGRRMSRAGALPDRCTGHSPAPVLPLCLASLP